MDLNQKAKLFKSFLRKNFITIYKLLIWMYIGIEYALVTLQTELKVNSYDRCHPFQGELGKVGFIYFKISRNTIFDLGKILQNLEKK